MISALSPTLFYYSQLSQKCQTISSKRSAFGYSESKSHPQVPQICCARCSARTSSSRFSCPSSQRRDGSAINSQPEPAKRSRIPCSSSIVLPPLWPFHHNTFSLLRASPISRLFSSLPASDSDGGWRRGGNRYAPPHTNARSAFRRPQKRSYRQTTQKLTIKLPPYLFLPFYNCTVQTFSLKKAPHLLSILAVLSGKTRLSPRISTADALSFFLSVSILALCKPQVNSTAQFF